MLNRRIADSLSSPNELMNRIIQGYITTKGKLIRPILVILTAKLFGSVTDRVLASAAAVEMLHNASLIHDDVVDDSMTRRSNPTINNLWGNHIAVLVGDFFVSNSLRQALDTNDIRICQVIADLGRLLSIGEIDQIYNARYHNLDQEAYFQTISRKTASLFVSCIKVGAYSCGVSDARMQPLCQFAELLGLCFQIKDDIFDYFEDTRIGKPFGNDLREGKITLPLLYALTRTDNPQCQAMVELSHKDQLTSTDIATLIQYAKQAGGIDYAYATMQHLKDQAFKILDTFPPSDATSAFASIFNYVISRNN